MLILPSQHDMPSQFTLVYVHSGPPRLRSPQDCTVRVRLCGQVASDVLGKACAGAGFQARRVEWGRVQGFLPTQCSCLQLGGALLQWPLHFLARAKMHRPLVCHGSSRKLVRGWCERELGRYAVQYCNHVSARIGSRSAAPRARGAGLPWRFHGQRARRRMLQCRWAGEERAESGTAASGVQAPQRRKQVRRPARSMKRVCTQ